MNADSMTATVATPARDGAAVAGPGTGTVGSPAPISGALNKSPWQTVLHESFTTILAATILVLTVWMVVHTFASGAETFTDDDKLAILKKDAYERQKDLMLYGLSLLGTVTGYYLGRVPAERRADSAQQAANSAQRAAADAQHEVVGATTTAAKAIQDKESAKAAGRELVRQAKAALDGVKIVLPARATLGESGGPPAAAGPPDTRAMQAAIEWMETTLDRIG